MLIQNMKHQITRFTYTALEDLDYAGTSLVFNIPIWGKDYVVGIYGRVVTAFVGASVTLKIGTASVDDCILRSTDLKSTGSIRTHLERTANPLVCHFPSVYPEVRYNDTAPIITFTSSDNNLADLTAGAVEIIVSRIVIDPK